MLGVVLAGIAALIVTHVLAMKTVKQRRKKYGYDRVTWAEARYQSRVARFV